MHEELKPCPFCKGENIKAVDCGTGVFSANSYVECKDCHAVIFGETLEKAIAAWNTRAKPTCEGCVHEEESSYSAHCDECTHLNNCDNYEKRTVDKVLNFDYMAPELISGTIRSMVRPEEHIICGVKYVPERTCKIIDDPYRPFFKCCSNCYEHMKGSEDYCSKCGSKVVE